MLKEKHEEIRSCVDCYSPACNGEAAESPEFCPYLRCDDSLFESAESELRSDPESRRFREAVCCDDVPMTTELTVDQSHTGNDDCCSCADVRLIHRHGTDEQNIFRHLCPVAYVNEHMDTLSGISVNEDMIRKYNYSEYFSSIIGYTGPISESEYTALHKKNKDYTQNDTVGKAGLEQYYETYLRGKNGRWNLPTVHLDEEGKS